jgi:hypothetical protein
VDEVKFVVAGLAIWEFAKETIARYDLFDRAKAVLISPVHGLGRSPATLAETVAKSGLPVRLNLQLHNTSGAPTPGVCKNSHFTRRAVFTGLHWLPA